MDTAALWLALVFGLIKAADIVISLWALVLTDPLVDKSLRSVLSPRTVDWMVPTAARRWNEAPDTAAWSPVFAFVAGYSPKRWPTKVAVTLLIRVGFRAPVLSAGLAAVVFLLGESHPELSVAVSIAAVFSVAATIVFYLVTISLGGQASEVRAGHVAFRARSTRDLVQREDQIPEGDSSSANVDPSTTASAAPEQSLSSVPPEKERPAGDRDDSPKSQLEGEIPPILTLAAVVCSLVIAYASLYFARAGRPPSVRRPRHDDQRSVRELDMRLTRRRPGDLLRHNQSRRFGEVNNRSGRGGEPDRVDAYGPSPLHFGGECGYESPWYHAMNRRS